MFQCAARSNPPPSFRWLRVAGSGAQEVTGEYLKVTEDMFGRTVYQCVVENLVVNDVKTLAVNYTFDAQGMNHL